METLRHVLIIFTLIWLASGILAWQRFKSIPILLILALLYYFSLVGSWALLIDKSGGTSGFNYFYLEDKMFPIYLDRFYLKAVLYYIFFLLAFLIGLFAFLKKTPEPFGETRISRFNHTLILLISITASISSFFIMRSYLAQAIMLDISGYRATRGGLGEISPYFTIHQLLNRVGLFSAAVGLLFLYQSPNPNMSYSRRRFFGISYIIILVALFLFCTMLGNKNELLQTAILVLVVYVSLFKKISLGACAAISLPILTSIASINYFRGKALGELFSSTDPNLLRNSFTGIFFNNEAFGAHLSMYGVLLNNVAPNWGYSIQSLLLSVVPRLFWSDRPRSIYSYYAEATKLEPGQGYALHHATGWYLNFDVIGLIIGALLLSYVCSKTADLSFEVNRATSSKLATPFKLAAFPAFCTAVPEMIRNGPESYKGFITLWMLLAFIFTIGAVAKVSGKRRLP